MRKHSNFLPGGVTCTPLEAPPCVGLRLLWEKPGNRCLRSDVAQPRRSRGDPFWALPQGHVPDMAGAGVRSPAVCFMLTGRRQAGPCWASEGRKEAVMSLAVPSPGFHTWGPAHPRPARPERKRDGQGHRRARGHGQNQIPLRLNLSSGVAWLFPDLPEPPFPGGVVGTAWNLWLAGMTIRDKARQGFGEAWPRDAHAIPSSLYK